MSTGITPEKAKALLTAAQPSFDLFKKHAADEESQWDREIESLQKRIKTAYAEIDLGSGHTIAIRVCLTEQEQNRLAELDRLKAAAQTVSDRYEHIFEQIEIITANPRITKAWLKDHRDAYSPEDLLSILIGYLEVRQREREHRIRTLSQTVKFRAISEGSELREFPEIPRSR